MERTSSKLFLTYTTFIFKDKLPWIHVENSYMTAVS